MDRLDRLKELYGARRLPEAWAIYQENPEHENPEWHLLGSLSAAHQSKWREALWAIDRALPTAGELSVKILFHTGYVMRPLGEYRAAVKAFTAALERLEQCPTLTPVLRGYIHYNRALALWSCRQYQESADDYRLAAEEFRREHMEDQLRRTLQNLAWTLADLGHLDEARAAHDEADPLSKTEQARWLQHVDQAHLLLREGSRTECLRICEWVIQSDAPRSVRCMAAVLACRSAGELALWDSMEQMGRVAINLANSLNDPDIDHRCWLLATETLRAGRQIRASTRGA